MTPVMLTDTERSVIESSLNAYWHDASDQLTNQGVFMPDGTKRPLGDIEKKLLIQRMELVRPIITLFESIH